MLESWSKEEPMRERDSDVGKNLTRLSDFLDHTQVSSIEELTMKAGEKESFNLALASLLKMKLVEDTQEARYLRTEPQKVLRGFITKLNCVRMAQANGTLDEHQEEVAELHEFFSNVITTDYNTAASKRHRGCFW